MLLGLYYYLTDFFRFAPLTTYFVGIFLIIAFLLVELFKKKIQIFNKKPFLHLSLVLLFIIKLIIIFHYTRQGFMTGYFEALKNHALEYLAFSNIKPPLVDLYFLVFAKIFSISFLDKSLPILFFNSLLNLVTIIFLYRSMRILNVLKSISFLLAFTYSLFLIPFEFWRNGEHYDHLFFFVCSFFIYRISRVIVEQSLRNFILLGVSCAIMIFFSTVNILIAPTVCGVLFIYFLIVKNKESSIIKKSIYSLCIPMLAVILILSKNIYFTGLKNSSSFGGPCLMLVIQNMFNLNQKRIETELLKANAPEWYLWCYQNRVIPKDENGVEYPGWEMNSVAFGICSEFTGEGKEMFPFDFRNLEENLKRLKEEKLATLVGKDVYNSINKHYLFKNFAPEATSYWMVQHSQESLRIAKEIIKKHPVLFFQTFVKLHRTFYAAGPTYVRNEQLRDIRPNWLRRLIQTNLYFAESILRLSYILCFFGLLILLVMLFRNKHQERVLKLLVFTIPALMGSIIFNSFSGAENHRYFIQISPYLLIYFGLLSDLIVRRSLNKIK